MMYAGFQKDLWLIKELAIPVEVIKNGTDITPLTEKESIAMTMVDLASACKFQHGCDSFVLKV